MPAFSPAVFLHTVACHRVSHSLQQAVALSLYPPLMVLHSFFTPVHLHRKAFCGVKNAGSHDSNKSWIIPQISEFLSKYSHYDFGQDPLTFS